MRELRGVRGEHLTSSWTAHGVALLCVVACLFGCSKSPLDDLPDTVSYEPSAEVPTQKYSTTYQPVEVLETNQPDQNFESNEPVQAGDN